ncbi:ATP synthase, gamma subunit [Tachypleus tridentatus]|uniref:ATP synthase, gamma subunit n=1 Tax=Tachypleus tridentatus TaxID=6853 RepID=UPI003FCEE750
MLPAAARFAIFTPTYGQVRGMATLKDIQLRLKSIRNIQKITQSMKMVSAAKYAKAERELKPARSYGQGAQAFYQQAEVKAEEDKPKTLVLAITSDRGLCGAVNSSVSKKVKALISQSASNSDIRVICLGDKSRTMLQRQYGKNIMMVFSEYGKKPPTFESATEVANAVLESDFDFDNGIIIYNTFKSVVSYNTSDVPIFTVNTIGSTDKLSIYDSIDAEVLQSFQEFSLASLIFFAMKESYCTEQSSRMTAMDGATKNAGEMIDKLTLTFNRTRQAVITRELIEIISGAAAL